MINTSGVRVTADCVQGKLPTLGWNSWNAFMCDIDATKVMTAANEVVNLGLKDAGYEYINSNSHIPPSEKLLTPHSRRLLVNKRRPRRNHSPDPS